MTVPSPPSATQADYDAANNNPLPDETAISLTTLATLSGISEDTLLRRLAGILDRRQNPYDDALADALRELDDACDAVAALRSQEIYLAMIAIPGTEDALLRLDRARQCARRLANGFDTALADIERAYPDINDDGTCQHGDRYDQCPVCSPPEPNP